MSDEIKQQMERVADRYYQAGIEKGVAIAQKATPPASNTFADMTGFLDQMFGRFIDLLSVARPATATFADTSASDPDEERIHLLLVVADELYDKVEPEVLAKILGTLADDPDGYDSASVGDPPPASMQFAEWIYEKGPRGGHRWKNAETGRYVYAKDKPGARRAAMLETRGKAHAAANEIVHAHVHNKATPDQMRELINHLPHLTRAQVSSIRARLMLSFGGKAKLAERIEALKQHVMGHASGMEQEERERNSPAAEKPDTMDSGENKGTNKRRKANGKLETVGSGGEGGGVPAEERMGKSAAEASGDLHAGTEGGSGEGRGVRGLPGDEGGKGGESVSADAERGGSDSEREGAGGGKFAADSEGGSGGGSGVTRGRGPGSADVRPDGVNPAVIGQSPEEQSLAQPSTPENPTDSGPSNFQYTDTSFISAGLKDKFRANANAIETLRQIQMEGRETATPEEQQILSRFIGWGQFKFLFNTRFGQQAKGWEKEQDELKKLLSSEEYGKHVENAWDAADHSTQNAHYTHPDIVHKHWEIAQKLGYEGGRFLETSAGSGYYLGMMPAGLAGNSRTSAVELDPTTAGILKLLYPRANVVNSGFEKFQTNDNFFDLVASNVPFGAYTVHDKKYNKLKPDIHDYFFLKSADVVRPGGLIMHITSTGTMDKQSDKIRQKLAETCDFVGAIRFPGAAHKENAGTDVVTDMVILRKRMPGEEPLNDVTKTPEEAKPKGEGFTGSTTDSMGRVYHWVNGKRVPGNDWLQTTTVPDPAGGEPIVVNKYFADNPQMVLGITDRTGQMYRGDSKNVSKTDDYEQRLQAATDALPAGIYRKWTAPAERFKPVVEASGTAREGGFEVKGGKAYVRRDGKLEEHEVDPKTIAKIEAHTKLRDALRDVFNAQMEDRDAEPARKKLNEVYDDFVKSHGPVNDRKNLKAFGDDPDSPILQALEHYDKNTKTAKKADVFTKDVVRRNKKATSAANAVDGLAITMAESGEVNIGRIAELTGKSHDAVEKELVASGVAFNDPTEGWKPASQYLSGNVRKKLALARSAAQVDPAFDANVRALEKIQPADLPYEEIDGKLGSAWIPPEDIADFIGDFLGMRDKGSQHFDVRQMPTSGDWIVGFKSGFSESRIKNSNANTVIHGAEGWRLHELVEAALNGQTPKVWDTNPDGTRRINAEKSAVIAGKVHEFSEKFKDWLWQDGERRDRLHRYYNDNFNNLVHTQHDGSHLQFPGMNPAIELRKNQRDFVQQVIATGGGLAAHEVGTGKTFTMIAAAMELRRMGLAKKPMIACKKANVAAIAEDARKVYPGAKILEMGDKFNAAQRKKTMSQIATGDWDMIICTHDNLDMLQMKPETQKKYIEQQLGELETIAQEHEAKREAGGRKNSRAENALRKTKANLEARLQKILDSDAKDNAVYFEDTGVDHLFIDESHRYKNLKIYSKMDRVKGMDGTPSERASDLHAKTSWLQDQNGGRGVVFATGTPITNTMGELFNLQRFLQPKELKDRNVHHFDTWARTFAEVQTKVEKKVDGTYDMVARLSKFTNIPELMGIARQMMDVQKADLVKKKDGGNAINRPTRKDAVHVAPETEETQRLMKDLLDRAEEVKRNKQSTDNFLAICTDGRKGSIDPRLVYADAKDEPESKANKCIANVLENYKSNPGKTQMIFSDMGVHPVENGFHLYKDLIDKMVAGGIPRDKIINFSELTEKQKEKAMEALNNGHAAVAIGSTEKLGTGVNAQAKLMALHHLDAPWQPGGLEQRDGRGWRQGNENKEIQINRYVSENTLDEMFWGVLANKANFIAQVVTPAGSAQSTVRNANDDDSEELSYEQIMAAASGDPRILERVKLEDEVKQLEGAKRRHSGEDYRYKDEIKKIESTGAKLKEMHEGHQQSAAVLDQNPEFSFKLGGRTYTERKDAKEALEKIDENYKHTTHYGPGHLLGHYRGLPLYKRVDPQGSMKYHLMSPTGHEHSVNGNLGSIEAVARNIPRDMKQLEEQIGQKKSDVESIKSRMGQPFKHETALAEKKTRLKELLDQMSGADKAYPLGTARGSKIKLHNGDKAKLGEAKGNHLFEVWHGDGTSSVVHRDHIAQQENKADLANEPEPAASKPSSGPANPNRGPATHKGGTFTMHNGDIIARLAGVSDAQPGDFAELKSKKGDTHKVRLTKIIDNTNGVVKANYEFVNDKPSRRFADESDHDDDGPSPEEQVRWTEDPDAHRVGVLLAVADELKGKVDPVTLARILGELADDPEGYDVISTGRAEHLSPSMEFAEWVYEEGPRGGKRWKNAETGRYVYGAEKPGGKREAATKTREEAHKAANTIIRDHIHGKATPDQLRDLINHIPHLNHAQLSSVRARLMASFGGKRGLQDRIEALKKHIEDMNEPDALDFGQEAMDHGKTGKVKRKEDPAKKVEPTVAEAEARNRWDKGQRTEDEAKGKEDPRSLARPEQLEQAKQEDWKAQEDKRKGDTLEQPPVKPAKKKPKIHETDATLSHIIKNRGGIRSDDHSFKAHFGSIKEAMEYGLSLGLFNKNSKQGLDQIAKSMAAEGHLIVPEGEDPVPHLVEGLKRKARSAAEDLTSKYDKAYEEYGKALEEAKNDGITSEQIAAAETEADRIGEAKGAEDKYGQGSSGAGEDTDFGFGANESKPESGSGSGSVDLFGNPIPKSHAAKAGQQITMDDALREAWVNKAHEWADEHGTKVSSLTASGTFKAGGKEYQVGKAEDGYPIKEIGAAAPVATSKVEPSTPKTTQPTPKAPVEGPPPSLDEVSRLYDTISQPNVSEDHVQQMMDRLKNAKKGDLKAIGDKIGMEFGASDTAGKMQEKIAKRFLNVKRAAIKSTIFNKRPEKQEKDKPLAERDTPEFRNRKFNLEGKINRSNTNASDDLLQSLDDAETHAHLDDIEAKLKAEQSKSGSRPKPAAPVSPPPAPVPEQPRRDYVHNPNAKGDPTPDEVAGLHDNIARRDITEPQVQQVADRIQGIKSKATLKEIGQKIDMTFGASDTVKQMADKVIKRLLNMKRTHIKSTIFDRKQEKPTEAAPAKAPTPAPSKFLAPHEMSREDYIKQQQPKIEAEVKKIPQDYLQDRQRLSLQRQAGFEHQDAVKAAVEKGQPVHESAAKDYPNIKPTKKIEPQEHEKPLYEFAKMVQQLADTSPYEERFGDKKAFISDIYKRSQTSGALPKMTLDQFKQQLLDANNKSFLNLATQDDPNIVPRDKHDESQIEYLGNPFHHVLTSDAGKYNDKEHHKSREAQEKAWGLGLGEKGYYNNNQ